MMKMITMIMLLALFCAACSKSGGGSGSSDSSQETSLDGGTDTESNDSTDDSTTNDNITNDDPPAEEPDEVRSLPDGAYEFETNVTYVNATTSQKTKLKKALEIIKLVIATDEFRTKILNHTYGGRKTFVDNGGYSNAQIYQKILDGAESLQPSKDNEMDMEVEMYYQASSTVGYTYPSSKRIWVNTKFFNQYTAAGVAHNLMHEWLHKLGFKHSATYSSSRDYSVPYAIGDLVGEIGKDFL